eukprot:2993724-Pleurochrysis_carterae.AAC.1
MPTWSPVASVRCPHRPLTHVHFTSHRFPTRLSGIWHRRLLILAAAGRCAAPRWPVRTPRA